MSVDIRGVNTHNKGAHLMLLAVVDRLGERFQLSTSPNGSSYAARSRLGLEQTTVLNQAPTLSATISNAIPSSLTRQFGLARDKDISGVVDAAGFAYSDSFSSERSKRESINARRWSKRHVPIVALPQAFGPFTIPERSKWSSRYLGEIDLAFARDDLSYSYLKSLVPSARILRSPDFTIGLKGTPANIPIASDFAALVPNGKLVSHGGMKSADYVNRLVAAGNTFRSNGVEPMIVVHEKGDRALASAVSEVLGCDIFEHPDPLVLKTVLGSAKFAVASRFHALVSALSQGTPAIAFGWSHKYEALLADFGAKSWLYTPEDDISGMISSLIADSTLQATLVEHTAQLKVQNDAMWKLTAEELAR